MFSQTCQPETRLLQFDGRDNCPICGAPETAVIDGCCMTCGHSARELIETIRAQVEARRCAAALNVDQQEDLHGSASARADEAADFAPVPSQCPCCGYRFQ